MDELMNELKGAIKDYEDKVITIEVFRDTVGNILTDIEAVIKAVDEMNNPNWGDV